MLHLVIAGGLACSDWMMDDAYGLSVRTMDLGDGPKFALKTVPKGTKSFAVLPAAQYGHIISVADTTTRYNALRAARASSPDPFEAAGPESMAYAGLNEAGLSCDLHALLNSSYPPASGTSKDLPLFFFCNWALAGYASTAQVKEALVSGVVHLWGPKAAGADGVHFILRDREGVGLAVEFMQETMMLHDDLNDGENGYGVFTNEPPFPWQLANVKHYLWKQSLARPATGMPGAWYPDERFLRIFLVKSAMPVARSYQEAVQHALHVLNTITVPMGLQMGTDSGFGEGDADHTHYAHIYDHKNATLYWRHHTNLQLERVRLADVLGSQKSRTLSLTSNKLPFFHDAAEEFA